MFPTNIDTVPSFLSSESPKRMAKEVEEEEVRVLGMNKYELGPWSYSTVTQLEKCPLAFYLKKLKKYKPVNVKRDDNTVITNRGTAAHLILEYVAGGRSVTDAYKLARKETPEDQLSKDEWAEHVESLEFSINKFADRLDSFNKNYPIKRVFTEVKIGIDKDWNSTGFFAKDVYYRSVIDLAFELENGDAVIIDHKTGGVPAGFRYYKEQLNVYKPMFHKGLKEVRGVQCGIHFIKEGEIVMDRYVPKADVENRLITDVEFAIECAIDKVIDAGKFYKEKNSKCKYCDFAIDCSQKLLTPLENESAVTVQDGKKVIVIHPCEKK